MSQPLHKDSYIEDGEIGTADYTGDWIDTAHWDEILFHVTFSATGTPAGNLYVQGKHRHTDFDSSAVNIELDVVNGTGFTHSAGDAAIAYSGATNCLIKVASLADRMRLFFDRSGGTSNTTLRVGYTLRKFK